MGMTKVHSGTVYMLAFFTHTAANDIDASIAKHLLDYGFRLIEGKILTPPMPFLVAHDAEAMVRKVLSNSFINKASVFACDKCPQECHQHAQECCIRNNKNIYT